MRVVARNDMRGLGEVLSQVLGGVVEHSGSAATLQPLWTRIVGPVIALRCRPHALVGGELTVRCDGPGWRDALEPRSEELLERLQTALGRTRVRRVTFEVA
jgi:predicted nucleic acid-binding Zn ribbon protein